MITLKDWTSIIDYKITDGSTYEWGCYGTNSYVLDSWNGRQDDGGFSFSIIYDTKTQVVFEVSACDYGRNRAYRIINPDYKLAHDAEAKNRSVSLYQAWDDVDYVDLDNDEDFLIKVGAIQEGEDYDTRVTIDIDFTDEDLLKYMKLAHAKDITFNQFIELAVQALIEESDLDPDTSKSEQWI